MKTELENLYQKKLFAEQMAKMAEEDIKNFLLEKENEITQEVIDYFYWETDLKTTLFPYGDLHKYASKNKERSLVCVRCKKTFNFFYNSRSQIKNKNDFFECDSCRFEHWKKINEIGRKEEEERHQNLLKLKYMPYKDYLKTEHWKEIRQRALKRSNYKCQLCNSSNGLNVHHRTYERKGCEYISDVIVLCYECHAKFHDKAVSSQ